MGLRMAMAPALRAFKQIFPFRGKRAPMQYAFRFGPELLGAGMMAAAAPPETSIGTRALIGGEDILASIGLSILGSGIGRTVARRRMGRKMGIGPGGLPKRSGIEVLDEFGEKMDLSGLSPAGKAGLRRRALIEAGEGGANIGDMVMMPAQFLRPSPLLNAAHNEYYLKQETAREQELAAQQIEKTMQVEGLMELLAGSGGVVAGIQNSPGSGLMRSGLSGL